MIEDETPPTSTPLIQRIAAAALVSCLIPVVAAVALGVVVYDAVEWLHGR